MNAARPNWEGCTVICIASGPSLTPEDCETARQSGHPVIVANTTFRACPWADVLFAIDRKWWDEHHAEVKRIFTGRLMTINQAPTRYGVETTYSAPWFKQYINSGACAVSLALAGKAKKIVLLGYDCQKTNGMSHWHGDHPAGMSNAASIRQWPRQFQALADDCEKAGVRIVNCSRATALTCFERGNLVAEI